MDADAALLRLLECIEAHDWPEARDALEAIRIEVVHGFKVPSALAAAMAAVRLMDKRSIRQ